MAELSTPTLASWITSENLIGRTDISALARYFAQDLAMATNVFE